MVEGRRGGIERKINEIYAGKIWGGFTFQMFALDRNYMYVYFHVYATGNPANDIQLAQLVGIDHLLCAYVFQKLSKALCGKSAVFTEDSRDETFCITTKEPDGSAKNTSDLYMPRMQAKDPCAERPWTD